MPRYDIDVCDEAGCRTVRTMRKLEAAKRAMVKAMRKRAKELLRSGAADGFVTGQVKEHPRNGEDGAVVYETSVRRGKRPARRPRPPRRPRPITESEAMPEE